jgi:hypothetical protein
MELPRSGCYQAVPNIQSEGISMKEQEFPSTSPPFESRVANEFGAWPSVIQEPDRVYL